MSCSAMSADPLLALWVIALNHYLNFLADVLRIIAPLDFALVLVQHRQAARFLLVGDGVNELQRGRVGTRRVLESKDAVVLDLIEQRKRLLEISFSLAWEPNDHVGCDADFAACGLDPLDSLQILLAVIQPLHQAENARGTALDGQMHVVAERRRGINRMDNVAP